MLLPVPFPATEGYFLSSIKLSDLKADIKITCPTCYLLNSLAGGSYGRISSRRFISLKKCVVSVSTQLLTGRSDVILALYFFHSIVHLTLFTSFFGRFRKFFFTPHSRVYGSDEDFL